MGGPITSTGTISHATGDGFLHVPATGTGNNGKFLMAGTTAGAVSWQAIPTTTTPVQAYSNTSSINSTVGTRTDMTGVTVTITPKSTQLLILFTHNLHLNATSAITQYWININGTDVYTVPTIGYSSDYIETLHYTALGLTPGTAYTVKISWQATYGTTTSTYRTFSVIDLVSSGTTTYTGPNLTIQNLTGTSPSWNVVNGVNATLTLTGNTTLTFSGMTTGQSGFFQLTTNSVTDYTLSLSGAAFLFQSAVQGSSANTLKTGWASGIAVKSLYNWWYDGTFIWIRGDLGYSNT